MTQLQYLFVTVIMVFLLTMLQPTKSVQKIPQRNQLISAFLGEGALWHPRRRRSQQTSRFASSLKSSTSNKSYHVMGTSKQSKPLTKITTGSGHDFQSDAPSREDTGPQPVELLLASFIGCTRATAIFVGRMMKPKLFIDRMEFDIRGERDERGVLENLPIDNDSELPSESIGVPARLSLITGTITVYAKKNRKDEDGIMISENAMKLLEKHTEGRCPVADMIVRSGCSIEIEWIDGNKKDSL